MRVPLRAVAHSRSGDKGNTANIAVIVYEQALFPFVRDQLTEQRLASHYAGLVTGRVTRYVVEPLGVLNFVCEGALGGGVSRNLCLDNYGKALAAAVLTVPIEVPEHLDPLLRRPPP